MNRKIKTTGMDGDFGRDYRISCGHHSVIAQKRSTGSGYDCQIGLFTYTNITLKEAKEGFLEYLNSDPQEKAQVEDDPVPDLWSTIDPCAVIVQMVVAYEGLHGSYNTWNPAPATLDGAILEVLDNHGYLDESGQPDFERAHREFVRHFKALKGGEAKTPAE